MKKALFVLLMLVGTSAFAQDVITLRWMCRTVLGHNRSFSICATENEKFIVDWGDGHVDTIMGIGSGYLELSHGYPTTSQLYIVTIKADTEACRFHSFDCSNQTISLLDVSESTALTDLNCSYNYLELVILNTTLKFLDYSNGRIFGDEVVMLNNCTELTNLNCSNNQLFGLDLSANTKLQHLLCNNCDLRELNISNCVELIELQCNSNYLAELNLDSNPMLERIECYGNSLQLSDLHYISETISDENNKLLGTQFLQSAVYTANTGESFFANQATFNGVFSDYLVAFPNPHFYPFDPDLFIFFPVPSTYYTIDNGQITFNTVGEYCVKMTNDAIVSHSNYPPNVVCLLEINGHHGISEKTTFNIQVYPNPTNDKFTVECENATVIKLYNILGKEVLSKNISKKSEISISHLPIGIYTASILSKGKVIGYSKIVKD